MFRKLLVAFLTTYGSNILKDCADPDNPLGRFEGRGVQRGSIVDPIKFIAAFVGRNEDTIYTWTRNAENEIGLSPLKLDPLIALYFIQLSDLVIAQGGNSGMDNPIRNFLMPKLEAFHKSQQQSKEKKIDGQPERRIRTASSKPGSASRNCRRKSDPAKSKRNATRAGGK